MACYGSALPFFLKQGDWWWNEIGMTILESSSIHWELWIFSEFAWRHRKTNRTCVKKADIRNFRIHYVYPAVQWTKGGVDWSGDIAVRIHKRSTRCRWVAPSAWGKELPVPTKEDNWTFPSFGEEENLSPPPGIEPRFLGQPAVILVSVSAEMSQSLCSIHIRESMMIFKGVAMPRGRNSWSLFLDVLHYTCYEHRLENVNFAVISLFKRKCFGCSCWRSLLTLWFIFGSVIISNYVSSNDIWALNHKLERIWHEETVS